MVLINVTPLTKAEILKRIETAKADLKALEETLSRNKKDLLKNYLSYDSVRIESKKQMLLETESAIKSLQRKINNYSKQL